LETKSPKGILCLATAALRTPLAGLPTGATTLMVAQGPQNRYSEMTMVMYCGSVVESTGENDVARRCM
jgi:hypothetical protein